MHKTLWRPAIAMIELIFAIVIIGIVLLSAPQLVSTSTQSGYVAVQQEAINEAATRLNLILGFNWDENNTNETFLPTVLRTTNGDSLLEQVDVNTSRRAGTPTQSYRSFFRSDGAVLNASAIGQDGGDLDDMDDFNDVTGLTSIENSESDYIETITVRITSNVSYGSDALTGGVGDTYTDPQGNNAIVYSPDFNSTATPTTNIKFISVRLESNGTSSEMDKNITLNAFSANIGAYDLEERVYP